MPWGQDESDVFPIFSGFSFGLILPNTLKNTHSEMVLYIKINIKYLIIKIYLIIYLKKNVVLYIYINTYIKKKCHTKSWTQKILFFYCK